MKFLITKRPLLPTLAVFLLCLFLLLTDVSSAQRSFEPYKGSLATLLPKAVGNYKLTGKRDDVEPIFKTDPSATDGVYGIYQDAEGRPNCDEEVIRTPDGHTYGAPSKCKTVLLTVTNFSSADRALEMLQKIRRTLTSDAGWRLQETGFKRISGRSVGQKFLAIRGDPRFPVATAIAWTHGSLFFYINNFGAARVTLAKDPGGFVKDFPY